MISIKIRDWVIIGGVAHTQTSYQVGANIAFTNIVDNHPNDGVNINNYYSPVVVPVGATYYVRVMRHFSNGTTSGWGEPMAVTNEQANGGVIVHDDIVVYRPVVTVDLNSLVDPNSVSYTINTSDFVAVNDGHGYTVWIVLNDKNEIIEYVKSTTNLTSITFTKNINTFLNTSRVRIVVIYGTNTGIESPPGESIKNITNVNFSISTVNKVHAPSMDLKVTLHKTPNAANNVISKIVLKDINGSGLIDLPVAATDTSTIIPGVMFAPETQYLVVAYGVPADEQHTYTVPVDVSVANALDKLNLTHTYTRVITPPELIQRMGGPVDLGSEDLFNNKFLVGSNGTVVPMVMNANGSVSNAGPAIGGINLGTAANTQSIYIRPMSNDRLLVDYQVGSGSRTTIYSVDYYRNVANVLATTPHGGNALGRNNGLVFDTQDSWYYVRTTGLSLNRNIYNAGSIVNTIMPLPKGVTKPGLVTKGQGHNLLLFATDANDIYLFDTVNHTYKKQYLLPLTFRGRTLKQQELINGDVLVWKPLRVETVNGVRHADTTLEMLYIDNRNNIITTITPLNLRTYNLRGSILTNSGEVLLISDEVNKGNVYKFN